MSGANWNPAQQYPPGSLGPPPQWPPARRSAGAIVAAVLLVVAAALAIGGSFAEIHRYSQTIIPPALPGESTAPPALVTQVISTTGWTQTYEPPVEAAFVQSPPSDGITLAAAAVLTLFGAVLLSVHRSGTAERLGAAGGGLIAGAVAIIWTGMAAGFASQNPDGYIRTTFAAGLGGWLLLAAGVLALAAVVVLLIPVGTARPHKAPPPPGWPRR